MQLQREQQVSLSGKRWTVCVFLWSNEIKKQGFHVFNQTTQHKMNGTYLKPLLLTKAVVLSNLTFFLFSDDDYKFFILCSGTQG